MLLNMRRVSSPPEVLCLRHVLAPPCQSVPQDDFHGRHQNSAIYMNIFKTMILEPISNILYVPSCYHGCRIDYLFIYLLLFRDASTILVISRLGSLGVYQKAVYFYCCIVNVSFVKFTDFNFMIYEFGE